MCILYVMIEDQPRAGGFKLILCSIRDEFFERPTKLAHKWTSENGESKLLGGMDMQEYVQGGTWLGMNMNSGDIGALLNIREPKPLARADLGRGFLVVDYLKLKTDQDKMRYMESLKENSLRYNGFSLITINHNKQTKSFSLSSYSNRSNCLKLNQKNQSFIITNSMRPIDKPFYRGIIFKNKFDTILKDNGLFNEMNDLNNTTENNLNTNLNDKIDYTKNENQIKLVQNLLDIMLLSDNYYDEECKGDYFRTQMCLADETLKKAISSLCVSLTECNYGSRTFTIILVDSDNQVNYYEWTRDDVNKNINHDLDQHFQFNLD